MAVKEFMNDLGLTDDEFLRKGGNVSLTHVDFMIGSKDLQIIGFKNGEYVKGCAVHRPDEWLRSQADGCGASLSAGGLGSARP